jgi:hypothetical protein
MYLVSLALRSLEAKAKGYEEMHALDYRILCHSPNRNSISSYLTLQPISQNAERNSLRFLQVIFHLHVLVSG